MYVYVYIYIYIYWGGGTLIKGGVNNCRWGLLFPNNRSDFILPFDLQSFTDDALHTYSQKVFGS